MFILLALYGLLVGYKLLDALINQLRRKGCGEVVGCIENCKDFREHNPLSLNSLLLLRLALKSFAIFNTTNNFSTFFSSID